MVILVIALLQSTLTPTQLVGVPYIIAAGYLIGPSVVSLSLNGEDIY